MHAGIAISAVAETVDPAFAVMVARSQQLCVAVIALSRSLLRQAR